MPDTTPKPAGEKPTFTIEQLGDIDRVLRADASTADLAERVIDALNDPGVSKKPNN
jgi:hypothetical protein